MTCVIHIDHHVKKFLINLRHGGTLPWRCRPRRPLRARPEGSPPPCPSRPRAQPTCTASAYASGTPRSRAVIGVRHSCSSSSHARLPMPTPPTCCCACTATAPRVGTRPRGHALSNSLQILTTLAFKAKVQNTQVHPCSRTLRERPATRTAHITAIPILAAY